MDYLIVIPARLSSTRLPRKPLIDICGKSMIERTYDCALKAINDRDKIVIATDSKEIIDECEKFDAKCILTSKDCLTGTDRVAEVSSLIEANQYINLQGDEPIFPFESIQKFINLSSKQIDSVHTCITMITKKEDFFCKSIPKMVFSNSKKLLYSSRSPIPANKLGSFNFGYKHVCLYAFNKTHLNSFTNTPQKTKFEKEEDLEINRFLELDITVNCIELEESGKAVDTEEDLDNVRKIISNINR